MSVKRRQLFVGVLDNNTWTNEKLCAYLIKHACTSDEQYITDCQIMSYTEEKFRGTSFAFVTFTDERCVDTCMRKRDEFKTEYGITIKRLLPDSISKCERLISTANIVVRLPTFDPLFTDENIRSYFGTYGTLVDLKMLEEANTGAICFVTFDDFDASDRILLDSPHYLNNQILAIHKYAPPEYVCDLSQFRFVDPAKARQIKKWHPYVRNLADLIHPLTVLYKTQIALTRLDIGKRISEGQENFNQSKENFIELENRLKNVKANLLALSRLNEQTKGQIEENEKKTEKSKDAFLAQLQKQREKNQSLEDAITFLEENV